MGKSGSGKTSMRSIIFANYIARDTRRLGATSKQCYHHTFLSILDHMAIVNIVLTVLSHSPIEKIEYLPPCVDYSFLAHL